jgi:myosin heavy subunit
VFFSQSYKTDFMAYIKTIWKARQGLNLKKFSKLNEDEKTVILVNSPDSITQEGTPFSEDNMNHIEQGIHEAHEAVENTLEKAKEYVNEHNESGDVHKDIRQKVSELSDKINLLTPEGNEELFEELQKLRQEITESNNAESIGEILKELQDLREEISEINERNYSIGTSLADRFYPVGTIYTSVENRNPKEFIGGTWISWGSGRVPVGVDTDQAEFNEAEKIGGEKTHQLTVNEMPSHTHASLSSGNVVVVGGTVVIGNPIGGNTGASGGNQSHNNLQPYITYYMWKRTE